MSGDSFPPMNIISYSIQKMDSAPQKQYACSGLNSTAKNRWKIPQHFLWTGKNTSTSRGNAASADVSVGLHHFVLYTISPDWKPQYFSSGKDFFPTRQNWLAELTELFRCSELGSPFWSLKSLIQHQGLEFSFMTRITLIEKWNEVG